MMELEQRGRQQWRWEQHMCQPCPPFFKKKKALPTGARALPSHPRRWRHQAVARIDRDRPIVAPRQRSAWTGGAGAELWWVRYGHGYGGARCRAQWDWGPSPVAAATAPTTVSGVHILK